MGASGNGKDKGSRCWVGIDLGGTKMMAVVFDPALKPLARARRKTRASEGVRAGVERMEKAVRDVLAEAKVDLGRSIWIEA